MTTNDIILSVKDLKVHFSVPAAKGRGWFAKDIVRAVDGMSFDLYRGETLGIVGESGCGKSTLARAILKLVPVTEGEIKFAGQDLLSLKGESLRQLRRSLQIIFQDPLASLNPRMTAGEIISEPLKAFFPEMTKEVRQKKVRDMMEKVGLSPEHMNRYPHEFSGGQCQRIGIARALISEPQVVVCDEPVSALDVSIQAQIVNLLKKLQRELNLTLIFIAHDLGVVRHISNRIMVMYLGRAVETGNTEQIYLAPAHPYTRALISAAPIPDPVAERQKIVELLQGEISSPVGPRPIGCPFFPRCPVAEARCETQDPPQRTMPGKDVIVRCLKD